ncbi:hypothetical protein BLA24_05010 [Streptomyces cinnamoneus]|uniref:Uncharacterized protein n=1 Tax=Streptomyces cinnamoneus TaxID=53446 RepID=A0A2G1XNW8_STRCJ|nr:hypothetical protein [Streptomyces cinnamoneus]PHQ52315.1 hypothetical protein BLA24_08290 [Streptomyces cinnamoneus]PHQ52916.1 hypothetical protein BLA24_05010 [Streptomyces cinnamoneus]PPT11423.1 hypothetical protein CYQ11_28520 [Streptomyces cinnamoneus]
MDAVEAAVEKIARTCLYEGYLLWPYRRSALKNTRRWTFGGVFPHGRAAELGEPSRMRTEVLLASDGTAEVFVRLRFLHVVERQVHRLGPGGSEPVDALTVAGRRYLTWHEATERAWTLAPFRPADGPRSTTVAVPGGTAEEPLDDGDGRRAGVLVRSWRPLEGVVELDAVPLPGDVWRVAVTLTNTTACPPPPDPRTARDALAAHGFMSTHTVLRCSEGAAFVSLADPPAPLRGAADSCRNEGTWPVLVGRPAGDRQRARSVLSSPVTLEDFPAVAPESPGDLFDGGEIDQLLILSVLSLTPREQEEARASDPRAREILDRCAALSADELMALHGTIREFRPPKEAAP